MTKWTADQEKAIIAPVGAGNILVSAAAGSGKTAVLVERIMRRIEAGASIDRMLVVTFTNAAAAEMREKIIRRLTAALRAASGDMAQQLKKQIQLAATADIMTIDAFCIRVVQNNFHVLGADPNMSIADKPLAGLIASDAMERVMAGLYRSKDEKTRSRLRRLVDRFASMRDDSNLCSLVRKIHSFITPFAEPEGWLDEAAAAFKKPISETPFAEYLFSVSKNAAEDCIRELDEIDDDDEYVKNYISELRAAAQSITDAEDWDAVYEIYDRYFKKKGGKKKLISPIQEPPEKNERLGYIRAVFVDRLHGGVSIPESKLSGCAELDICAAEADDLIWLVKRFMKEFAAAKEMRGVREFSDVEHLTYELFKRFPDIRAAYRDKYDEILIDEYQDTNGLQDSIFSLISHNNIFMVGDLKQSIYLFRGGDPYIFKAKSRSYSLSDTEGTRLTLAQNFRSRQEVLRSVNDVFTCVMSAEAGDVNYTGDELITRDSEREYYPDADDMRSELHYIMTPMGTSTEARTSVELKYTAKRISELLKSGTRVFDTATGAMRPIQKRDIVILENSTRNNGDRIVYELGRLGIDAYCDTESFFDRREIKTMLSLIAVLNNASLDIPLIAVMRSPIWSFTDNELAMIRLVSDGGFAAAVARAAEDGSGCPEELSRKCRGVMSDIRRWRAYVRHKSVAQLIWTIYEESGFYDIMGAIERDEESQFNLRLLYERAVLFERAGFRGLFSFIKYIETIEALGSDIGGAKTVGENHDVVRVMTIHKSKGLEFPFVFMIGAGKNFYLTEKFPDVRLHKDLMMGLFEVHPEETYARKSKWYELVAEVNEREYRAERMRLLYVAMTRAREKLFITAVINEKEDATPETVTKKYTDRLYGGRMLPTQSLAARGFYDWICPAALSHPDTWECMFCRIDPADAADPEVPEAAAGTEARPELRDAVYSLLDYSYPYTESNTIPSRTSVTQIKELTIERESIYERTEYEPDSRRSSGADDMAELMFSPLHQKPAFMQSEGGKAANEIGTLYHLVMSSLDLERVKKEGADCVMNELSRLVREDVITAEDAGYIDAKRIEAFLCSPLGQRMLASREVHREAPFQINIAATEYDPSLPETYGGETVILQGIIDCYFREGDGYILFDYKTDRVHGDAAELREKYNKQLELYKKAIETLTRTPVRETYLYLFDTGEAV